MKTLKPIADRAAAKEQRNPLQPMRMRNQPALPASETRLSPAH
jgi:hypothetical protein